MASVTLAELREPKDLFDRAAVMPRPVRKHPHGPHHELEIEQRAVTASLHPQLPVTPAWTYDGRLPGPVVVVDAGKRVRVIQDNDIVGTLPYRHVVVDDGPNGVAMNDAGSDGTSTDRVEVEYPVGHRRRRAEAVPLLRVKFAGALATRMPAGRADPIRRLFEDPDRLDATPVGDLVGMFVA